MHMTAHEGADLTGLRILVVEDEALIAMDLEYSLEDAGATVVGIAVANSEALSTIAADRPDAVLLDYNLMDGEAAPTARAAIEAGVAVVFHSGHASREFLQRDFPNCPVLPKPTPSSQIVATLAAVCRPEPPARAFG